ncbi:MAG TPA: alpha/beta fold hydrolase [Ramlibacter sp.]|nr:alpha/beta fold hydrolase [Ramlibacter sp.]
MPAFHHGDVRLQYQVLGEGPPLMLVPGFNGTGEFWAPVAQRLAARWRIILPSYRATTPTTADLMAGDLQAVLDHAGIDRACVAGHSFGSAQCQLLALRAPHRLRRLVLSATFAHLDGVPRRWFELRRQLLELAGVEAFVRLGTLASYSPDWLQRNFAAVQAREAEIAAGTPPLALLQARIDALLRFDSRDRLRELDVPTRVIAAADDALTPLSLSHEVADAIPGALLQVLDDGGHSFPRSQPAAYAQALEDFFGAGR